MSRSRLGRGLEALIPTAPSDSTTNQGLPQYVAVDQIQPSTEQQRQRFATEPLHELTESIRQHGILQPILLRRLPNGFELIAGERRWRAAQQAGLTSVPAIIREEVDSQTSLLLGLIENLQREDLDPIEEAQGIRQLIESFGLTHEEAAARVGKNRVSISNSLRLLNGCPALLSATVSGAISAGHARALVGLPSKADQEYGLKVVLSRNLSVRQTEKWIQDFQPQARQPRTIAQADQNNLQDLRSQLKQQYNDSADISGSTGKGKITLSYRTPEELSALLQRLL
ncbi:MAG: ParB/RepB/Spo0J family partition protein [Candidatus Dormibacteraceae bacterium]